MEWSPTQVYPRIWQSGSIPDGIPQNILWQLGITYIVNLCGDRDNVSPNYPKDSVVSHVHWNIEDGPLPDLQKLSYIATRVARAQEDGQNILIHCAAGINRSSLVSGSALWLLGVADPYSHMKLMKPDVLSNSTFANFLQSADTLRYTLGNRWY